MKPPPSWRAFKCCGILDLCVPPPSEVPPQHQDAWLESFGVALARQLEEGAIRDKADLHRWKQQHARDSGAPRIPTDADLLAMLPSDAANRWTALLRTKPTRSASGVAVVAVMSSPAWCPHGKCVYCPGGPDVNAPQSYTGFEPSTMRAMRHDYDPYRITRARLGQLERNGHATDKVDVVIQGGTFPARDAAYRDWFVAGIYAGLNAGASLEDEDSWDREEAWAVMTEAERDARLLALMQANESAPCRAIGLTIETKPDWCLEPHVDDMLRYGATRVEIGLQTLDEDTLRLTHRGHGLQESRDAMRIARDAGLKVCIHTMPGLPRPPDLRTDPAMDLDEFRRLWGEEDWRPDMLKIYPTLVVMEGETPLKKWWREGRYTPYDTAAARDLLVEMKAAVPEYCRIQRIDRDIPTTHVEAGIENSNIRQMVQQVMEERGLPGCRCIRCREPGRRAGEGRPLDPDRLRLVRREYPASGGMELFVTLEDPEADAVAAFLRLRRTGPSPHRPELQHPQGTAIVRELKVFGTALALGEAPGDAGGLQHRGLGARLLEEAESVAFSSWGVGRLLVIAGVGVREYYRRHGYQDLGAYVAREAPAAEAHPHG